ncbi:MAG: sigma-70 family RNA polymerase sigma factor [Bacteroidales bacterium]|nr:sigma-70 family RNA polymerase sigma factor [Bacteroidales bacterium]
MSERELAALCSRSDRSAFKELYTRYATRVLALCFRYVDDRDEAEDLMHDTMVKVFGAIKGFNYKGEGSLYAWIRRIAVNLSIDRIRKRTVMDLSSLSDEDLMTEEKAAEIPLPILMKMISTLPETQRLILNLYCIDGLSHNEIASLLGIKPKTSSSLLAKAKRLLNEKVAQYLNTK